jgi:FKBP-type peptidyl-prolyl cis-trans isomerase FkpA
MSKAALREQRRAQRLARRNRQRIIIIVIVALVVLLIAFFVYRDYKSRSNKYPIGTLDQSPPAPTANAVTTASGLIYEDLQVGDGATAKTGDTVSVHYIGWLADGTKFDSSLDHQPPQPLDFALGSGSVIAGWEEGVQGMNVNGTRLLIIPPNLAYGTQGYGTAIPPNATLTFEVQLVAIK